MNKLLVPFLVLLLVAVGCQPKTKTEKTVGTSGQPGGAVTSGVGSQSTSGMDPLTDPNNPRYNQLQERVIYFEYDKSEIQEQYRAVIEAHAAFLMEHRERTVTLEGHADERGSSEYNIALGEQRAKSVAKMLKLQGVTDTQLQVVSFGEEKPAVSGHDESAYQQNRRVELAYPGH